MTALLSTTYKPLYASQNDNSQTGNNTQNSESSSFFDFLNIFSTKNDNKSSFSLLDETIATFNDSSSNPFAIQKRNNTESSNIFSYPTGATNAPSAATSSNASVISSDTTTLLNENTNTACDGRITDFKQGNTNDCWLLAGIKAVANDPEGERLLVNAIKENDNGWVVRFPGAPNQEFTVTREQLENAKKPDSNGRVQLSTGDDDVTILELAARQYYDEEKAKNTNTNQSQTNNNNLTSIDYGYASNAIKLLTGQDSITTYDVDNNDSINEAYTNNFQSLSEQDKNYVMQIGSDLQIACDFAEKKSNNIIKKQQLEAQRVSLNERYNNLQNQNDPRIESLLNQFKNASPEERLAMGGPEKVQRQLDEYQRQRDQQIEQIYNELTSIELEIDNNKAQKEYLDRIQTAIAANKAKQQAYELITRAQNEPDQVSMAASRMFQAQNGNSFNHAFIVSIDKATGDFLVNNPHDTSATPERYNSADQLLSRYSSLTLTNDIK